MTEDLEAQRQRLADAFGRSTDPLAEYEATFNQAEADPFELFKKDVLESKNITPRTRADYRRVFEQWRAHMGREGRHPACPSESHIRSFIQYERAERANHPDTIQEKLRKLAEVYRYWQAASWSPHSVEYNPFRVIRQTVSFDSPDQKPLPRIPLSELRSFINRIQTLRALAIVLIQLKLGLRATEVCNLVIGELHLHDSELQHHYDSLGGHWMVTDRPNAVYVPHDRYGNKSGRPRVLPIDAELREVLTRYLLIRLGNSEPWIFLSERGNQMRRKDINRIWRNTFHPEYEETENHRPVLSHYGRHRFTTYWRVQQDLPRPLVKYLRGDQPGSESITDRDGIDEYIHTYYEDIQELYREKIYRLGI